MPSRAPRIEAIEFSPQNSHHALNEPIDYQGRMLKTTLAWTLHPLNYHQAVTICT